MARQKPTGEDGPVSTMICVTCGTEQFFTGPIPAELRCANCGGTVFREFDTPARGDQAAEAAAEEQARSMSYGDPSPEGTSGDAMELDDSSDNP